MNEVVIGVLLVYLLINEYLNRKERKKLLEMVMAKSLPEFKEAEKEEKPVKPVKRVLPDLEPIETASSEAFEQAIKKELGRESHLDKAKEALKEFTRRKHGG